MTSSYLGFRSKLCQQYAKFVVFEYRNRSIYSHGQELFYKFVHEITNKLVKQLLSMTVFTCGHDPLTKSFLQMQ